jgi:hypothetical protein
MCSRVCRISSRGGAGGRFRGGSAGLGAAGLALAALLWTGGCNPFRPRQPEPPCDPNTDPTCVPPHGFLDPLEPEIVRQNVEGGLETFTVDENYKPSLSDRFIYIPDPAAEAVALPGFFAGWNKDREVQFMLNVLQTGTRHPRLVQMDFSRFVENDVFPSSNETRYEVDYSLTLTFRDETKSPPVDSSERYSGRALWDFTGIDQNHCSITKWEDLEPQCAPGDSTCQGTLGILRATSG